MLPFVSTKLRLRICSSAPTNYAASHLSGFVYPSTCHAEVMTILHVQVVEL